PAGILCAIRDDVNRCFGESGTFGYGVFAMYEDRNGNLWAGASERLWKWRPEPATSIPLPGQTGGVQGFAEAPDGTLLISTSNGIQSLGNGSTKTHPVDRPGWSFDSRLLLRDRDGALWSAAAEDLVHIRDGGTERYAQADGLSGDTILKFFEDREGNVWVATTDGLDRFHDTAVSTYSVKEGLPHSIVASVAESRDGGVLIGTVGGIARWANGTLTAARLPLPVDGPVIEDDRGRLWFSAGVQGFGYVENGGFVAVKNIHIDAVRAMAQGDGGSMWVADRSD